MVMPVHSPERNLAPFGFTFERGGTHLARSMMLEELRQLLTYVPDSASACQVFATAIISQNCLGKRSARTRKIALRHLRSLYGLDAVFPLFRAMRYFWERDPLGQPLLACLIAYARDAILRQTAPFILRMPIGEKLIRSELEEYIDQNEKGRFSPSTLRATVRNVAATWTHSGHLAGHSKKNRSAPNPTPGTAAVALLLGYIEGGRGESLLESQYAKLLDCGSDRVRQLAEDASRKGWIVLKRIGTVMEVRFPNLLTKHEQEWIHEQG